MNWLIGLQIVVGLLLILSILPQGHGGGLGAAFGSSSYHTRKGVEKSIFSLTVVLAILFTFISIIGLL